MEGASGYPRMKQHSERHSRVGGSIPVPFPDGALITRAGHPQVMEKAIDLLNSSLRLYCEIYDHCPFPGWKKGLQEIF